MSVAIIDYGSGNLHSAAKAFQRAARESGSGCDVIVTADAEQVARAERIVLPGVGAFADCRRGLEACEGMVEALEAAVIGEGRPFLGTCVGMQLMAARGLERGNHPGFGWIDGEAVAVTPAGESCKVPHMGWNELEILVPQHPLFEGIATGDHAYFVHGFHLVCANQAELLARVVHGGPVSAAVGRDNMVGTQFHPEKSQAVGLRLITNFLNWRP